MKKKIIAIFCLMYSVVSICADFPHETTTEHYSTNEETCADVCVPKYKDEEKCEPKYKKDKKCEKKLVPYNGSKEVWTNVCEDVDVPDGQECHTEKVQDGESCSRECHTETEWHTRIKELETYYVTEDAKQAYQEAGKRGADVRYGDDIKKLNIEDKWEKFNTGNSIDSIKQKNKQELAREIANQMTEASRETGLNYVVRKQEGDKIVFRVVNKYVEAKQNALVNEEARKKLNDMASSGAMFKLYKDKDNVPNNVVYERDDTRVVDPALKPIVKKPGESITEEERKSNRPIWRIKEEKKEEKEKEADYWHHFEEEHHVNKDDGYRYYTYYSVSFNSNGATQGYTPSKITKIKDSYVTIPYNEGELTKPDYKMVGWNTSPNGYGTTYNFGETTLLSRDITLYAKWEKVEKVKPSKPIEHKTYYQIKFINGDHVTITGDKFKTIEKGKAINYVPSIKVDNEFKFKCWLGSNGKTYTDDEVKELIPTSSINFLAIVEGGEKTQSVPKPQKVKEKYNITFTANEHSKLKGTSNLEIEEQTKINNVPEVIVDEGYIFKNWLGSDGNTYTIDAIKELIPTTDMSFLVVTELKPKEKIKKPEPKKPELPKKIDEKQTDEKTETRPTFNYVPLEVYVGDKVSADQIVDKSTIPEFLVFWDRKPNTSVSGKAICSVNLMNVYTGTKFSSYPTTQITVLPKPELNYKHDTIYLDKEVTVDNCINRTLSDRYQVNIIGKVDTSTIGRKEVHLEVIDTKLNRKFTGYTSYITVKEDMDKLTYNTDYIYVGDKVTLNDVIEPKNIPSKYKIEIIGTPDTNKSGLTLVNLKISNPRSNSVWNVTSNVRVINKPTLIYKNPRRKLINNDILESDVVDKVMVEGDKEFKPSTYTYNITNQIDTITIGTKVVELKVTDTHKNRVFTGYTTDITLYENLENLNYKPDPEIYEGDDTKVDDIIDKKDIPSKYKITIKIPADSKTPGRKITRIIISNPTSGSTWEVDRPITVLPKPTLVYKNPRRKHINLEIVPDDVVANKLDDRYKIEITNKIDIITIGTKPVELKIIDTKLNNREFTGFTTDITLYEDLLDLNYKPNPEIYVGDDTKVDDIIDKHDIPSIYKITIKIPADSNTPGRKTTKIIITNPTSGSVWEVDRPIEVIPEPELVGKDLWIYQNDKNPDDKGKQFINKITVDLNKRFEGRYVIKYKGHGDISKIGKTKFTYIITDLQKNRTFEKQIDIEVREEVITPKINENTERFIGHIYTVDELIEGIDKNVYIPEITNKDEMMEFRLTPGKKIVKVKITSTITGKVWTYDVPVIYKEKIVDLGELLWEKGEVLTIEDIRKQKNLPKDHTITLRKGDLDTSQLGSKMLELVIMDKDRVYYVGKLKLTIVENKTIEDIHKIDDGTKVHLITYVDDISNRATKKLIEKSKDKDLWFEQTNNFLKYNLDQKANILGGRIGYDHYFEKQKAVLGGYVGYERATWNLSDVSKQNLFHMGMYGGKELYNTNNGKNKFYLGGVGQYTFINGTINVKNIRNERVSYKQTSHNILANGFIGLSHEYSKNSNIALNLGDTLLYSFNNKYIGKTQNVKLDNNIANEVYTEIIANKKWDRFNIYSNLKLGYLFGKTHYTLNKAVWDYTLKKFNIKISGGADYDITDNFTVGVEGWYKHHDKSIKLDAGCKAKFEYRW